MDKHLKIQEAVCAIKYMIPLGMVLYCFTVRHETAYFLMQLLELALILAVLETVRNKWIRQIVSIVLLLIFEIQVMVMAFSTTYVSVVMVTNLFNLQDLAGHGVMYTAAALTAGVDVLLPAYQILPLLSDHINRVHLYQVLCVLLACDLMCSFIGGNTYSTIYNAIDLTGSLVRAKNTADSIENTAGDAGEFYQAGIDDRYTRPENLAEHPNIVLIFTEGLSQNVVEDDRNFMPNVRSYENNGLDFDNYYNHTFATYKGLVGQLYSGYVFSDGDTDHLISLQSILKDNGYHTSFINTEPHNFQFMKYLDSFGFDNLISDDSRNYNTQNNYMSDREAYEELWNAVSEEGQSDTPFMTAIYTFGTHASLDSDDLTYGDGSDHLANKFYNVDHWFGEFMNKLENSDLAENTLVIFTADHCTYQDDDFTATFPDYERASVECDRIPLFFYYKGIEHQICDTEGRTSVTLAPTILDYIDISGPNYFLGSTAFGDLSTKRDFDSIFSEKFNMYDMSQGSVAVPSYDVSSRLQDILNRYYAAEKQDSNK